MDNTVKVLDCSYKFRSLIVDGVAMECLVPIATNNIPSYIEFGMVFENKTWVLLAVTIGGSVNLVTLNLKEGHFTPGNYHVMGNYSSKEEMQTLVKTYLIKEGFKFLGIASKITVETK